MKAQDYNQSSYQFVARLLPSNKDVASRTMSIEKSKLHEKARTI